MDGGFTEGSSIAHTIASMQKSCIDDPTIYDCSQGLRLSNIVGNGAQPAVAGTANGIPRLFANCNCGQSNYDSIGKTFDPQLFSEEFPSDLDGPGWELYSTKIYGFNNNTKSSMSYAWRGNVTTVTNTKYGVSSGMTVELIIIFPEVPPQDAVIWPGKPANIIIINILSIQYYIFSNSHFIF